MLILSCDYDDTLFVDGKVSQEDIKAIRAFQEAGNLFIVNTGRHLDSIFSENDKFNFNPDYFISNNGNSIADAKKNVLYMAKFDNKVARDILAYFDENLSDKVYFLAADDGYNFGPKIYNAGCEFLAWSGKEKEEFDLYIDRPLVTMFAKTIDPEEAGPVAQKLNEVFEGRAIFFNNDPYVDIVEKHEDKGTALEWLINEYDYDRSNVYAIGDGLNDLSKLNAFNGYAVENAVDEVKEEMGERVVGSVSDLIYKIIDRKFK